MTFSLDQPDKNHKISTETLVYLRGITSDAVLSRLCEGLRRFIGPKKELTYEEAAVLLGEKERNIKAWCLGESFPCLWKFLRLAALLGPDFTNEFLRIAGMDGAVRAENEEITEFQALADTAEFMQQTADALKDDGRVNHTERKGIIAAARKATASLTELLAADEQRKLKGGA